MEFAFNRSPYWLGDADNSYLESREDYVMKPDLHERPNSIFTGPVLWALDLNEVSDEVILKSEAFLSTLLAHQPVPVYIAFVERERDLLELYYGENNKVKEKQKRLVERIDFLFQTSKLVIQKQISEVLGIGNGSDEEAQSLIKFATSLSASLIFVGNDSSAWLKHFLKGSFPEILMAKSPIPVLVMGSQARPALKIRKILVPTEFTIEDHQIFMDAIEFAKALDAKLELFHGVYDESKVNLDFSGPSTQKYILNGESVDFYAYRAALVKEKTDQAAEWVRKANFHGVDTSYEVTLVPDTSMDILDDEVKKFDPDLIIMETRSSAFKARFLGSVTKHLVRKADCPVLVYSHTHFKNRKVRL